MDLIRFLHKVEEACEIIVSFWTIESDKFLNLNETMKTNHAKTMEFLTSAMVEENIEFWTKAKEDLDLYANAMNVIAKCCKFTTSATPPKGEPFRCVNLDFELSIPSDMKDVASC